MDQYILDDQGNPVRCDDIIRWGEWMERNQRVVAHAMIGEGVRVSTVFLGIDHSFGGGEPLLYETMIFGGPLDEAQWRYTTREQAVAGHAEAVAMANMEYYREIEADQSAESPEPEEPPPASSKRRIRIRKK